MERRAMACARLLLAAAAALGISAAPASSRQAIEQTRKAFLTVEADSLELKWNADTGEGRGAGEVFVLTIIRWGGTVEKPDPQRREFGPLGGTEEFPTSEIVQDPPGSGMYRIEPAVVGEGLGRAYNNKADCPVPTTIGVEVYVWEDDNNTDVKYYADLILKGIKLVVDEASQDGLVPTLTDLATQGLLALIDWLTFSTDDPIGKFSGSIPIQDPCQGFFTQDTWVSLDNLIPDQLWASGLDKNGFTFLNNRGIANPAIIGRLKLNIFGGLLNPDYASSHTEPYLIPPPDSSRYWHIRRVDLGQDEECFVTGALDLKASLPSVGANVTYRMYLDTDHQIATGVPSGQARGAEYEIRLPLTGSPGVAPLLYRYVGGPEPFELVAGAVVSSEIDLDGGTVFLHADRASLGSPSDSIAAWAVSSSVHGEFVAPPDAHLRSPVITVQQGHSGLPPTVDETYPVLGARDVATGDSIVITFSKHVERYSAESAFSLEPFAGGLYSWDGPRLTFVPTQPLEPGTLYRARLQYSVMDCQNVQLDGNGDLNPGDGYEWWFATEPLPLHASSVSGERKDRFAIADPVFATGSQFPPGNDADVYLVVHDSLRTESAWPLVDVTGAPIAVTFDGNGTLPLVLLGTLVQEGEYNVVVDLNRDGYFNPGTDRIDQTSIGLAVLGTGVEGIRDATCSTYGVSQTTQTDFGNSTLGDFGFANGSELNAACATFDGDHLRLFIAGNLESNFNKLEIFFDSAPGGQNRLRGNNPAIDFGGLNRMGDGGSGNGLRFDAGFEADYWIGLGGGNPGDGRYHLYANYATLPTLGGGLGVYLGETGAWGDGSLEGGVDDLGIRVGILNLNDQGVTQGCGPSASAAEPYGVEMMIPLAAIGDPAGCVRMTVFVNGSSHDFVSNQFLGPLPPGTCNLGEPRAVDLSLIPGSQHFAACGAVTAVDLPQPGVGVRAVPSPFRDQVAFRFGAPSPEGARAEIFDVAGRRVRILSAAPGADLVWDGRSSDGAPAPVGLYLVRLHRGAVTERLRVVRLR